MKKIISFIKKIYYNSSYSLFKIGCYSLYLQKKKYLITSRDKANYICALSECWKKEEARALFMQYVRKSYFYKDRYVLMKCAQYFPEEVLECALRYGSPPLVAGLFEKLNMQKELRKYLIECSFSDREKYPELSLYLEGWNGLNTYFQAKGLSPCFAEVPWTFDTAIKTSAKEGPLVSIIMTTFNTEKFVGCAIESIRKQTYTSWELIIVDDCSSDNTVEIIESYARCDSRIKFVRLNENMGTYQSKNRGLNYCRGEFITCFDSDDWSHPEKLECQIAPMLQDINKKASISYWIRMTDHGRPYAKAIYPLLRMNLSSLMYRRSIINKEDWWDCVRCGADNELYARIKCIYGKKSVVKVKLPLSVGRHRLNSLTTSVDTGLYSKESALQRIEYCETWYRQHLDMWML